MLSFAIFQASPAALAVIVGVNQFQNGSGITVLDQKGHVPGVAQDIKNVQKSFVTIRGARLVGAKPLTEKEATLAGIRGALSVALKQASAKQQVVLYYSGLGASGAGGLPAVATYSSTAGTGKNDLPWVEITDWCSKLRAKGAQPVVIMDCSFPAANTRSNLMPMVDEMRPRTLGRKETTPVQSIPQAPGAIYFLAADLGGRAYSWFALNNWSGVYTDLFRNALYEASSYEQVRARLLAYATTYCRGPQLSDFFPGPRRVDVAQEEAYASKPFGQAGASGEAKDVAAFAAQIRRPVVRLLATNDQAIRDLRATDVKPFLKELIDEGVIIDKTGSKLPDVIVRLGSTQDGGVNWKLEFARDAIEVDLDGKFDDGLKQRKGTLPAREATGASLAELFTPAVKETMLLQCLEAKLMRSAALAWSESSSLTTSFSFGPLIGKDESVIATCQVPQRGLLIVGSQSGTGRYRLLSPDPNAETDALWRIASPGQVEFIAIRDGRIGDGDYWTFVFVPGDTPGLPTVDYRSKEFWEQRLALLRWMADRFDKKDVPLRIGTLRIPARPGS